MKKGKRMTTMIQWSKSKPEVLTIAKIARRAVKMAEKNGVDYSQMTAVMDIEACHCNGCPLKLSELLLADDSNFAHDVFGIRRHIDRETGQLKDCFVPRYAAV